MFKKVFVGLILLLGCSISRLQSDDWYREYWQELFWRMWENDKLALASYAKIDTGNHFKNIRSIQLKEQLRWKVSENFSFEFHYAYIHDRSIIPNSLWRWQHRLEIEAKYTFHLPCNWLVNTRNRLEIRRVQAEPKILYRWRQRIMLVIPFENKGSLKSFSIYNELFYDISTRLFTQDRLCPFELTFALSKALELDLFFLVRFFYADNRLRKSAVLGTQFSF